MVGISREDLVRNNVTPLPIVARLTPIRAKHCEAATVVREQGAETHLFPAEVRAVGVMVHCRERFDHFSNDFRKKNTAALCYVFEVSQNFNCGDVLNFKIRA